mgnify:CR=1 FL=1
MSTYLRWKPGEDRFSRPFMPLVGSHPLLRGEQRCAQCAEPFQVGDVVRAMAVGPDSLSAVRRHEQGGWYSAYAVIMHQACVSGEPTEGDGRR